MSGTKHGVWNIIPFNHQTRWLFSLPLHSPASSHPNGKTTTGRRKTMSEERQLIMHEKCLPCSFEANEWANETRSSGKGKKSQMESIFLHCFIILLKVRIHSLRCCLLFPRCRKLLKYKRNSARIKELRRKQFSYSFSCWCSTQKC